MKIIFGSAQLTCSQITVPVPLCQQHYNVVYSLLEPRQECCATCGVKLKKDGNHKVCPQPQKIQEYLQENASFEGTIREGGKVYVLPITSASASTTEDY